jgi:uncharacterized protein (TIGR03437 family)
MRSQYEVWVLAVSLLICSGLGAQAPVLPAGGVVNGASFTPASAAGGPVAPGTIVAIFGQNLADSLAVASSVPLSTNLNGTTVTFGGTPAPLFFVSSGQANAQVPFNVAPGTVNVRVTRNGQPSADQSMTLAAFSPGIFTLNQQGTGQGAILLANSATFAAPAGSIPQRDARPVARGDFITIFCTGLGAVDPPVQSGVVAPSSPLALTTTQPTVTVGEINAPVSFSGLSPGFVGLYQINVQIPQNAPTGNAVNVQITIGGVVGNVVTIAVQ